MYVLSKSESNRGRGDPAERGGERSAIVGVCLSLHVFRLVSIFRRAKWLLFLRPELFIPDEPSCTTSTEDTTDLSDLRFKRVWY